MVELARPRVRNHEYRVGHPLLQLAWEGHRRVMRVRVGGITTNLVLDTGMVGNVFRWWRRIILRFISGERQLLGV